jgi:hypothetical protein
MEAYIASYPSAANVAEARKKLADCALLDEVRLLPEHIMKFLEGSNDSIIESVNGLNYEATKNLPRSGMYISGMPSSRKKWITIKDPKTSVECTFNYLCGTGSFGDLAISRVDGIMPEKGSCVVFKNGHRYIYKGELYDYSGYFIEEKKTPRNWIRIETP